MQRVLRLRGLRLAMLLGALSAFGSCVGSNSNPSANNGNSSGNANSTGAQRRSDLYRDTPLDQLPTATILYQNKPIRVWLAADDTTRTEGLMHVPSDEIADDQGMLFIFVDEQVRGFWMRNTIAPLDIAFARMDGTIVATHQMPPLTLETHSSIEPALFALEMKAGAFAKFGIVPGGKLVIPDQLAKSGK